MKILLLGMTGMAGSMIYDYFTKHTSHEIVGTSRQSGLGIQLDVMNSHHVHHLISFINVWKPQVVINCIGVLVKESNDNPELASRVNWAFPHVMASACDSVHAKLIHISTDCIFDGKESPYNEDSAYTETNVYGRTKALGEVKRYPHLTLRTSIVGPDIDINGTGLMNWVLKQTGTIEGYSMVQWNGITTLELAKQIEKIVSRLDKLTGIYHLTTDTPISKYDLLCLFKKYYDLPCTIIPSTKLTQNKCLINQRKGEYDCNIPALNDQIKELSQYTII
jgi:dTDP-4-dehydrorhamnose reductase